MTAAYMNVAVDNREHDLIGCLKTMEFPFSVETLDVGDIVLRDSDNKDVLTIERKTFKDWEASIIDGRYKEQKHRLLGVGHRVLYLLEGSQLKHKKRMRISENALRGSLLNTSIRDGVPIVRTASLEDTALLVTELERRFTGSGKNRTGIAAPKISARVKVGEAHASKRARMNDPKIIVMRQLMCIPGVSENVAHAIVAACGTTKEEVREKLKDSGAFAEIKIGKRKLGKKLTEKINDHF
jgi:ERCC4-type nuclease